MKKPGGKPIEYPGYIINISPHCTLNKKNRERCTSSCHNTYAKSVGKKQHMFEEVAEITFAMINMDVSISIHTSKKIINCCIKYN